MNEFLKSLQAFGMEGMGTEVEIEAYASSECAEELIELDNLDAATVAMESMSDAIIEGGLEMQTLALESAGFTLDTASGFTGELSTEAVGNMVKRGYYEVKIQVKKAIQKIWKLILSMINHVMGSEGRLKSYGKLFKKYNERLAKVNPKDKKDGEEKDVTVRAWHEKGLPAMVELLKAFGGEDGWIKDLTTGFKTADITTGVTAIVNAVMKLLGRGMSMLTRIGAAPGKQDRKNLQKTVAGLKSMTADAAEEFEKNVEESLKDLDLKDALSDFVSEIKDVDSDEYPILTAKANLLNVGRALQTACNRDLKFKKQLISLKKAWDKKTGEWELKGNDEEANRATAAVLRTLNKCGSFITGYRLALSKIYSAVASNMQGVLADMAKVIAKGTNIGA